MMQVGEKWPHCLWESYRGLLHGVGFIFLTALLALQNLEVHQSWEDPYKLWLLKSGS